MLRNILCLFVCVFVCFAFVGCSSSNNSTEIVATWGENSEISLAVGESVTVAFKIDTDDPVFQSDFSVSVTDSGVANVIYSGISGNYVYYNIVASAKGETKVYLEMPGLNIRSDAVSVKVENRKPDKIISSLGENPTISIPEGSSRTICFYIGEDIMPEEVKVFVDNAGIASATYSSCQGPYFYYKVDALNQGTAELYAEVINHGLKSEKITVSVVEKGAFTEYEEIKEGFICNTSSKIFHKPSCTYALTMSDKNKLIYPADTSRQTIIDLGYTACRTCNP